MNEIRPETKAELKYYLQDECRLSKTQIASMTVDEMADLLQFSLVARWENLSNDQLVRYSNSIKVEFS